MHRTWHRGITTAGSFRAQAEAMILCQNLNTPCQKTALPPDISDAWTGAFCQCDWQEMKSFKKCDHIATSFRAGERNDSLPQSKVLLSAITMPRGQTSCD